MMSKVGRDEEDSGPILLHGVINHSGVLDEAGA